MKFLHSFTNLFRKNREKKRPGAVVFSRLNDTEKTEFFKQEAEQFTKKYGKVIKALANE